MALLLPRATLKRFRTPIALGIVFIHLVALLAPAFFTWQGVVSFFVMYYLTACIGITFCYHRLLSHKSFKAHPIVRYLSTFIGCLALQGGPIWWVSHHRLHHRESDKEMDPHSPRESFLWSHCIWFNFDHPLLENMDAMRRFIPDMGQDPIMVFYERTYILLYALSGFALLGIGTLFWDAYVGWSMVFWGLFLRTVCVWHSTWFVNSATHRWGYKSYDSGDDSLNNWWVALLTFGEGWHNNHHAKQRVARSGHRWWELDVTYWHIAALNAVRLVWDVVPVYQKKEVHVLSQPVVAQVNSEATSKSRVHSA